MAWKEFGRSEVIDKKDTLLTLLFFPGTQTIMDRACRLILSSTVERPHDKDLGSAIVKMEMDRKREREREREREKDK
jgi:hypothetical protein